MPHQRQTAPQPPMLMISPSLVPAEVPYVPTLQSQSGIRILSSPVGLLQLPQKHRRCINAHLTRSLMIRKNYSTVWTEYVFLNSPINMQPRNKGYGVDIEHIPDSLLCAPWNLSISQNCLFSFVSLRALPAYMKLFGLILASSKRSDIPLTPKNKHGWPIHQTGIHTTSVVFLWVLTRTVSLTTLDAKLLVWGFDAACVRIRRSDNETLDWSSKSLPELKNENLNA